VNVKGHLVIEFILHGKNMVLIHQHLKEMTFIPRGYLVLGEDLEMSQDYVETYLNDVHMNSTLHM
jgi:hypothetical protein